MEKIVLFSPAYGSDIGTGHLRRCLVLAQYFANNGFLPVFFGDFQDINFTTTANKNIGQKITVIDDYSKTAVDHKSYEGKIMVIDDLANRHIYCDFLLDQNYNSQNKLELYKQKFVDCNPRCFFGLEYCLLGKNFFTAKQNLRSKYCLIFMTGGNCKGATIKAIEGAILAGEQNIKCVASKLNPNLEKIKEICFLHNIELFIDTNEMANLIAGAKFCIGAFGSNTWERMFLHKKTIGIILADNQEDIALNMGFLKLAINCGWYNDVSAQTIADSIINNLGFIDKDLSKQVGDKISSKTNQMVIDIITNSSFC